MIVKINSKKVYIIMSCSCSNSSTVTSLPDTPCLYFLLLFASGLSKRLQNGIWMWFISIWQLHERNWIRTRRMAVWPYLSQKYLPRFNYKKIQSRLRRFSVWQWILNQRLDCRSVANYSLETTFLLIWQDMFTRCCSWQNSHWFPRSKFLY